MFHVITAARTASTCHSIREKRGEHFLMVQDVGFESLFWKQGTEIGLNLCDYTLRSLSSM